MSNYIVLNQRVTRPVVFRTAWDPIDYACREKNGSLKPVPPGSTRQKLYCGQCQAMICLLRGNRLKIPRDEDEADCHRLRKINQQKIAYYRRRGYNTAGKPLQRSCWNCTGLRVKGNGYVCHLEPETEPASMQDMDHRLRRAAECQDFELRLVLEIPEV